MIPVLVIYDDMWHPTDVIARGLRGFMEGTVCFDFVKTAKDILTEDLLAKYPVIFNCKSNQINAANTEPWFERGVTEVGPAEFKKYVEKGGVLAQIHSGCCFAPFLCREEEQFRSMNEEMMTFNGCRFTGHPPRCAVTTRVTNPDHPLMKGVLSFTERDEHYQMEWTDSTFEAVMVSESETGGTQTACAHKRIGTGHLMILTPGHTAAVWENAEFRKILRNIISLAE